jgi:hypothetical protein
VKTEKVVTIKAKGRGRRRRRGPLPPPKGNPNVDRRRLVKLYDHGPFWVLSNSNPTDSANDVHLPYSTIPVQRGLKDLLILQVISNNPVTPDGSWTSVSGFPTTVGSRYYGIWWRRWEPNDDVEFALSGFNPATVIPDVADIMVVRNVMPTGDPFYSQSTASGTGSTVTAPAITTQGKKDAVVDMVATNGASFFTFTNSDLAFTPAEQSILNGNGVAYGFGLAQDAKQLSQTSIDLGGSYSWVRWSAAIRKASPIEAYPMPNWLANPTPSTVPPGTPIYMKGDVVMVFCQLPSAPTVPGWTFSQVGTLNGTPLFLGVWESPSDYAELDPAYFTEIGFVIPYAIKNASKSLTQVGVQTGQSDTATGTGGSGAENDIVVDMLFYENPNFDPPTEFAVNSDLKSYSQYYLPYFNANASYGWIDSSGTFGASTYNLGITFDWAVLTVRLKKR